MKKIIFIVQVELPTDYIPNVFRHDADDVIRLALGRIKLKVETLFKGYMQVDEVKGME